MHNQGGYHIERLTASRLKDLAILHAAVYGSAVSPEFFPKKYATAYTGKQYIGFVAYNDQQEPVGYYGVIPCFLRYQGEKLLAAQSGDTMTHPGYRFKGLFVELASLCYALCREEGIHLIFGFPNQHSYHGAVHKLGWQIAGQMDCFSVPVAAIPFAKFARKTVLTKKLFDGYADRLLKKHAANDLPDTPRLEGFDGVDRDKDHLRYKTYYRHYLVQLHHGVYWIKLQDALVIGDMVLTGEKDLVKAISELRRLAMQLGLRRVQYHLSQGTELHSLLAEQYEPVPTFPVLFRDLGFSRPLDRFRFSFGDIDIF